MNTIKSIMHVIEINRRFTMIAGLHGISVRTDGDTLMVYPFVQDPTWDGWRNFTSPDIRITSSGEVFSIHEDAEDGDFWDRLTERSHPVDFVSSNQYDWGINFFMEDARAVKEYILHLAAMWAAYNSKEVNA